MNETIGNTTPDLFVVSFPRFFDSRKTFTRVRVERDRPVKHLFPSIIIPRVPLCHYEPPLSGVEFRLDAWLVVFSTLQVFKDGPFCMASRSQAWSDFSRRAFAFKPRNYKRDNNRESDTFRPLAIRPRLRIDTFLFPRSTSARKLLSIPTRSAISA